MIAMIILQVEVHVAVRSPPADAPNLHPDLVDNVHPPHLNITIPPVQRNVRYESLSVTEGKPVGSIGRRDVDIITDHSFLYRLILLFLSAPESFFLSPHISINNGYSQILKRQHDDLASSKLDFPRIRWALSFPRR